MSDYVTREGGSPRVGDAVYYAKAERCERCVTWKRATAVRWAEIDPGGTVLSKSLENNEDGAGECRVRAPVCLRASVACTPISQWPLTHENDWCGEFRPIPGPPAEKPIDSEGDSHRRGRLELRDLLCAEPQIVLYTPATIPGAVPFAHRLASWRHDLNEPFGWYLSYCDDRPYAPEVDREDFFVLAEIGNRWLNKHRPAGKRRRPKPG